MIPWVAIAWAAPPRVLDIPFPTDRLFDTPDRVCLLLPMDVEDTDSETELVDFSVRCTIEQGQLSACVTLLAETWPEQVPPLQCGPEGQAVYMRPVPAFDPAETIWDGVKIVRNVAVLQGAYRVDHEDAPGILPGGRCGISEGRFWFKTRNQQRRQTCTLVIGEKERLVEIRLVKRLKR